VALLGAAVGEKVSLVAMVSDDLTKKVQAGKLVGEVAKLVKGGGGGRPNFATAGGKDTSKLDDAMARFKTLVQEKLS